MKCIGMCCTIYALLNITHSHDKSIVFVRYKETKHCVYSFVLSSFIGHWHNTSQHTVLFMTDTKITFPSVTISMKNAECYIVPSYFLLSVALYCVVLCWYPLKE